MPCSLTLYTRHLHFEMDTKSENLKLACVTCRLGKCVGIGRGGNLVYRRKSMESEARDVDGITKEIVYTE